MQRIPTTLATLALALSLAGCGSDGSNDVATDPVSTSPTPSPTPSPTAEPTVGTYPAFEPTDYTYTLEVSCFCVGVGAPIMVTVVDDRVVDAVYGAGQGGTDDLAGQQADEPFRVTIDDVIEAANDTGAHRVDVEWPAGQAYPTSVYVDQDEMAVDEEIGYQISDVVVAG